MDGRVTEGATAAKTGVDRRELCSASRQAHRRDALRYLLWSRFRREQVQHEIVNGLRTLQCLVVFGRLRLDGEGCVRITKPRGVGSQCIGGVGQRVEAGINLARKV